MTVNTKISNVVRSQAPFFVRNDHPLFISFLEAYYEYLEQSNNTLQFGKTIERAKNLLSYKNIDETLDDFATKLYDNFIKYIPQDALVDKRLLVKHIQDFYRSKGSEKSMRFLLQILLKEGSTAQFYYPKKDTLIASDGKWYVQKSLRINDTKIEGISNSTFSGLEKYISTRVRGLTSNTTAIVEKVDRYYEQGTAIDEIILSNIDGSFENGESVESTFIENDTSKKITSNVFGGIVNAITITDPGTNYNVGDPVILISSTGSGACVTISKVSTGNVSSISVLEGGAGYSVEDAIVIYGTTGSGANANISLVLADSSYHPNSYNLFYATINSVANIALNTANYGTYVGFASNANINTSISSALSSFKLSNLGSIVVINVISPGSGYESNPSVTVASNTILRSLGTIGKLVVANGGFGYQVSDKIEFINPIGGYGSGASANVTNVHPITGTILSVKLEEVPGQIIGGTGYGLGSLGLYNPAYLPTANVRSANTAAYGANIVVKAILGEGLQTVIANSQIGKIERVTIVNRGVNYTSNTTVDLSEHGDGMANATVSIIEGAYSAPGRYLNDDGFLSSYNFLQDRDYYQKFSYVIKVKTSIEKYRQAFLDLVHPAGLKYFGEVLIEDNAELEAMSDGFTVKESSIYLLKTYEKIGNTINVNYASHTIAQNSVIGLEFVTGGNTNVQNGFFTVYSNSNPNHIIVKQKSRIANVTINNAGRNYNANSYLIFTGDGKGANATYSVNSNGSIVSVTLNEPGIQYTYVTLTANGTNSSMATFNVTLQFANTVNGNVIVSTL